MAASFKLGQKVQLIVSVPQGSVEQLTVNQEGEIQYLVSYMDKDGEQQSRWFLESELEISK